VVLLTAAALAGCKAEPPDALSHLPADAELVAGVDLGRLARWPGLAGAGPLSGHHVAEALAEVAKCGVDLDGTRVLVAGRQESWAVVVAGAGVGKDSTLSCIGRADYQGSAGAWFQPSDDGEIALGPLRGRAISDDRVLLLSGEYLDHAEVLGAGGQGPGPGPVRDMLGEVDFSATAWMVTTQVDPSQDWMASVTGLRIGVATDEGLKIDAMLWNGEAAQAAALQAALPEHLAAIAGWIYAARSIVDDSEITLHATTVSVQAEVTLAQWQALDVRYVAERRRDGERDDEQAEAEAEPKVAAADAPSAASEAAVTIALAGEPEVSD
jgi:hypothetical protein